jgi:hypothetical protein
MAGRRIPNDIQIDVGVVVDNAIPHAGDLPPWNIGRRLPALIGNFSGRLAYDLQLMSDCKLEIFIKIKFRA